MRAELGGFGPAAAAALLRDPAVLRLWLAGALIQCGRWLDILAFSILVLRWTGSPLAVSLALFTRMLPLLLFGSVAGALADRVDRRKALLFGLAGVVGADGLGAWSIYAGAAPLPVAFALSAAGGLFWSMELTMRRGLLAEAAGMASIGVSMGLELLTANATRMIGPAIGGTLVAMLGFTGVLLAGAVLHGLALVALLGRHVHGTPRQAGPIRLLSPLREGWRHVRATPVLIGTVAITAAINLFGFPYVSLVPVVAREVLELGPAETGLLVACEGLGATIASLAIVAAARPAWFRRIYSLGALSFLSAVILFGHAASALAAAACLFFAGIGMAGFNTMQTVLMLAGADPLLRGRSLGILVGSMGLAPFGFLLFGITASWLGAAASVRLVAAVGICATGACLARWQTLLAKGPVTAAPVPR